MNVKLSNIAPSVKSAKLLFFITILSVIVVGSAMQYFHFWIGLALTEVLLILIPVLIFIYRNKHSFKSALRLNNPGIFSVILAILTGLLIWPISFWIHIKIQNIFFSGVSDLKIALFQLSNINFLHRFIVMGVLASICEEFLFRGYIQTALEAKFTKFKSILWTTLLFSLFHLDPRTIIATLPISFLLSSFCWRFNSIYPAIIIHFTNNFLAPYLFVKLIVHDNLIFAPKILIITTLIIILIGVLVLYPKQPKNAALDMKFIK